MGAGSGQRTAHVAQSNAIADACQRVHADRRRPAQFRSPMTRRCKGKQKFLKPCTLSASSRNRTRYACTPKRVRKRLCQWAAPARFYAIPGMNTIPVCGSRLGDVLVFEEVKERYNRSKDGSRSIAPPCCTPDQRGSQQKGIGTRTTCHMG